MPTETMKFDATIVEVQIEINHDGTHTLYDLREANEATASEYESMAIAGIKIDGMKGDSPNIQGLGTELSNRRSYLVHRCLFFSGTQNRVPQDQIKNWPERIVQGIYVKAKEISNIDQPTSEESSDSEDSVGN